MAYVPTGALTEHPAFVCRREGHIPTIELRPNVFVASFICKCSRCGRYEEFKSREPIPLGSPAVVSAALQTDPPHPIRNLLPPPGMLDHDGRPV